eukprot:CAMPEP_0170445758 /NCGR_PEP_ID=MMETSP0117_2-20130122/49238_1 /TAXON_ID=400756 /ORGANISM="Durinskia baltica, Strain CSIRO CS-38" /LENGTH=56 /DNA_ID=CAMNT_0010706667 /DNA_START=44 /DNA_END=211 /DNA_ORIENTATION=-
MSSSFFTRFPPELGDDLVRAVLSEADEALSWLVFDELWHSVSNGPDPISSTSMSSP